MDKKKLIIGAVAILVVAIVIVVLQTSKPAPQNTAENSQEGKIIPVQNSKVFTRNAKVKAVSPEKLIVEVTLPKLEGGRAVPVYEERTIFITPDTKIQKQVVTNGSAKISDAKVADIKVGVTLTVETEADLAVAKSIIGKLITIQ